jgi:AraC-like DNA-binding protein
MNRVGTVAPCPTCGHIVETRGTPDIRALALRQLAIDLAGTREDCWRFFATLIRSEHPAALRVRHVARDLGIHPGTLQSRFLRAGLPSANHYQDWWSLVYAAALLEDRRRSFSWVVLEIGASSPQAYNRTIRRLLNLTGRQFRTQYDGAAMFQLFRERLILPYQAELRQFAALASHVTRTR